MFRRDFMPRSHNATFEQRESGLDGIGMNVSMCVLAGMIDRFMHSLFQLVQGPRIDSRFVSHNHFDLTANVGAGVNNLELGSLSLNGLELNVGAGESTINLDGSYQHSFTANIRRTWSMRSSRCVCLAPST